MVRSGIVFVFLAVGRDVDYKINLSPEQNFRNSFGGGCRCGCCAGLFCNISPTFFAHPFFLFFFALSTPPFPRQFSSPKSCLSGTSDLLFRVKKRQPPGAGFWGWSWTGLPHRGKQENPFFFLRRLKFIQYRTGGCKCLRSLSSPDPSPSTG